MSLKGEVTASGGNAQGAPQRTAPATRAGTSAGSSHAADLGGTGGVHGPLVASRQSTWWPPARLPGNRMGDRWWPRQPGGKGAPQLDGAQMPYSGTVATQGRGPGGAPSLETAAWGLGSGCGEVPPTRAAGTPTEGREEHRSARLGHIRQVVPQHLSPCPAACTS